MKSCPYSPKLSSTCSTSVISILLSSTSSNDDLTNNDQTLSQNLSFDYSWYGNHLTILSCLTPSWQDTTHIKYISYSPCMISRVSMNNWLVRITEVLSVWLYVSTWPHEMIFCSIVLQMHVLHPISVLFSFNLASKAFLYCPWLFCTHSW
jgi:hypothetical protein